jgi:hypothetical protein
MVSKRVELAMILRYGFVVSFERVVEKVDFL